MYHGQVMVEQERIPQLLQTAQLLEVRGLCEIREGQPTPVNNKEEKDEGTSGIKGNQSFLAGLLNTSVSAMKRSVSVSDTNSNSSPTPPPIAKRQRSSGGSSRPVPMLQSILSQQLAVPTTPTFDLTKSMGSSTRALTALASKVQANTSSSQPASTSSSNSVNILPTSLENLLGGLSSVVMAAASTGGQNNGADISTTSSSDDEMNEKEEKMESSFGDMENSSGHGGPDIEPDAVVEIKEEPLVDFEDEFGDDSSLRGAGGGLTGDEESESETELRAMSDSSRGEAFSLPLLAQHLAAPNLLSASAKLRAAASQARHLSTSSSDSNPIMSQVLMGPSTPPDAGPASMSSRGDAASPSKLKGYWFKCLLLIFVFSLADFDPLGGDPPRKLAFHEPRPCPICRRMYRDAATLRTHTAIMHAEGRDPFACLCGELFRTKYEMYNHKKNGHR